MRIGSKIASMIFQRNKEQMCIWRKVVIRFGQRIGLFGELKDVFSKNELTHKRIGTDKRIGNIREFVTLELAHIREFVVFREISSIRRIGRFQRVDGIFMIVLNFEKFAKNRQCRENWDICLTIKSRLKHQIHQH